MGERVWVTPVDSIAGWRGPSEVGIQPAPFHAPVSQSVVSQSVRTGRGTGCGTGRGTGCGTRLAIKACSTGLHRQGCPLTSALQGTGRGGGGGAGENCGVSIEHGGHLSTPRVLQETLVSTLVPPCVLQGAVVAFELFVMALNPSFVPMALNPSHTRVGLYTRLDSCAQPLNPLHSCPWLDCAIPLNTSHVIIP